MDKKTPNHRPLKRDVLMVVQQDYYHDERVKRYVEGLIKVEIKVDVVCTLPMSPENDTKDERVHVYTIPVRHKSGKKTNFFVEYILAFILFFFRVTILSFKYRYDIIHVHNIPDYLVYTGLFAKLLGTKIVLDIHDPMPEFFQSKFGVDKKKIISVMIFLEKISTRYANGVITANYNFRKNILDRKLDPAKIIVVHNLADQTYFSRTLYPDVHKDQNRFVLLYPGTLAPRYGLEIPIKAMKKLSEKIPEIQLVYIGFTNDYSEELKQLSQQYGVEKYVQVRPGIPVENVPVEMMKANIGLYPAYPDAHMDIATPTKVLEYAVMELPIVASELTVLKDTFYPGDILLFKPGNIDGFIECILYLYQHPEKMVEMTTNVRNHTQWIFEWETEFSKYFDFLKKLCPRFIDITQQ